MIDPGPIEGHQDESLVTKPPVTETKYLISDTVELSTFGLYRMISLKFFNSTGVFSRKVSLPLEKSAFSLLPLLT